MKNAIAEVYSGLKSLFIGMRITIGQFFKPIVTVQYPYQTLRIPARFRGHIELVRDSETGKPKCFVCKLCEKACPSDCITVEGIKPEGAKRKTVTTYRLDFTKCSLCGSCVEACRDGAIRFSRDYNLAGLSKEDFIMDLFKRLQSEGEALPAIEQKPVIAPALPSSAPVVSNTPTADSTSQAAVSQPQSRETVAATPVAGEMKAEAK